VPVPGCLGGEDDNSRTDYCVKAPSFSLGSDGLLDQGFVVNSTIPPIPFPGRPKPTQEPSTAPTTTSTQIPSDLPSDTPSTAPTTTPTQIPSDFPSNTPSVSSQPTFSIPPSSSPNEAKRFFQIRLHWTNTSCWQEDCETDPGFCMQCEGYNCNVGDELWVEPCRADLPVEQLFEWLPIPGKMFATSSLRSRSSSSSVLEWGLLQSAWDHTAELSERLCFERVGSRYYKLQYCDIQEYRQWFRGFDREKPFELNAPPSGQPKITSTSSSCITMPHHPRNFEYLYHTSCSEAREHTSSLWRVVYGQKDGSEPVFDPESYYQLGKQRAEPFPPCTENTKCGMCEVSHRAGFSVVGKCTLPRPSWHPL
jgi:hypothetical protein